MVRCQNRRWMSQIRRWQSCLHNSKSTWKINSWVGKLVIFFRLECSQETCSVSDFPFYLPKAERESMSHPRNVKGPQFLKMEFNFDPDKSSEKYPFHPALCKWQKKGRGGGGIVCFPPDTQIPLYEEEVAGWEWLGPPDQSCWWVAGIHKSGSSVNLLQVLESQPSVNMLPQDRMGFKGFLSPKKN